MSSVGIIANPSAGKDIRRLVAQGRVVSNQEKSNILRRVFAGLHSMGVERVLVMPDFAGLARQAIADWRDQMRCEYVPLEPTGNQRDSEEAARMMRNSGVKCIVTLGGDGTNRVVAKGCGDTPIAPISTGTNNVFPQEIEGTLAGIAAGSIATIETETSQICRRSKKIEILIDNDPKDMALVDAAVSRHSMVGARAVWDVTALHSVYLARAEPTTIGISSIGARLRVVRIDDPHGLRIDFAEQDALAETSFTAPIAPGMIPEIRVSDWGIMTPEVPLPIETRRGTIALDGEREIELLPKMSVSVQLQTDGPWVLDFDRALELAAQRRS